MSVALGSAVRRWVTIFAASPSSSATRRTAPGLVAATRLATCTGSSPFAARSRPVTRSPAAGARAANASAIGVA